MTDLIQLLEERSKEIVDDASASMQHARMKHYAEAGESTTRQRLQVLFDLMLKSLKEKNLEPVITHAETVAQERFRAGFGLGEVQTAFNVLEETLWTWIVRELPPGQLGEALGLVGTVLGAGKDELARTYVALASRSHAPSLNLEALFRGAWSA
jgi:hypothetical protein